MYDFGMSNPQEGASPQGLAPTARIKMTDQKVANTLLPAALVKAQAEVKVALKGSTNTFHHYKYASAEEVLTVGRDALNDNGLSFSPTEETIIALPAGVNADDMGGAPCILRIVFLLEHTSGESRTMETHVPVCPERSKQGGWSRPLDKALFGARTESLGYALRDLLLIPRVDAPNVSGRGDNGDRQAPPQNRDQRPPQRQQQPPVRQEQPKQAPANAAGPSAKVAAPTEEQAQQLAALKASWVARMGEATDKVQLQAIAKEIGAGPFAQGSTERGDLLKTWGDAMKRIDPTWAPAKKKAAQA